MTIFHHRPRTARRAPAIATGIACVLLLAGTSIGLAQDARRPTEAPRSAEQRQADEALVSRAASNLLARTLMRRTRNLAEPKITDYRLTALGLNVAGRAHPDDVELLRNEIEAWTAADDAGRLIDATRRLVRLDPRDTIAQSRMIASPSGENMKLSLRPSPCTSAQRSLAHLMFSGKRCVAVSSASRSAGPHQS